MKKLFLLTLALVQYVAISSQPQLTITTTPSAGAFPIVANGRTVTIAYDKADHAVVGTVADAVAADIQLVTGQKPEVTALCWRGFAIPAPPHSSPLIIAGTLGRSEVIDQLAAKHLLKNAAQVSGKWETFAIEIVTLPKLKSQTSNLKSQTALIVYGSDPRGTAYGLFHLSRLMGVSPWVWWADVVPEHKAALYAQGSYVSREPSVKFRGMFINDEDWGLTPWAAHSVDKNIGNIGPGTYVHVMELLLRLRANTLWPAMHACSFGFWVDKKNVELARQYDIVLGSSHCEQMALNNLREFGPFLKRKGYADIPDDKLYNEGYLKDFYNWTTHQDWVKEYWAMRVGEGRGMEVMYTLGMRGVHDRGINGFKDAKETARGLADIIAYQRQLISDSLGGDPTKIPQLFIPYKEVLEAYNEGLQVPDDVTLCWVDDNHGYIRQMPTPAEQQRSGGNGIYYHLSYYGTPISYVWLSTVSPTLASFELTKAYTQNARNLWIINVGDIKPQECEFEFCMDLAYDVDAWQPQHAWRYARHWSQETFGDDVADELAEIRLEYYRLAASGKPEHITSNDILLTDEERSARISDYRRLCQRVDRVRPLIPARLQDAFYELVEYPVKGAAAQNVKALREKQSHVYAQAGQLLTAAKYATEAQQAYDDIQQLTRKYNKDIAQGKWDYMMDCHPTPNRGNLAAPKLPTFSAESATASAAAETSEVLSPRTAVIPGGQFVAASANVQTIRGLGNSDYAATVWPLDLTAYNAAGGTLNAPYADYDVPVLKGQNTITVRALCSFPLNTGYDLRVGIALPDRQPQVISVMTKAMNNYGNNWHKTVLKGYSPAEVIFESPQDTTIRLRVYFMDPGLVINDIYVTK